MSQTNNINPSARSKTSDVSARNNLDRREFLKKTAALTGGALALSSAGSLFAKSRVLPKPNKSGVDHIVLVTMENRSFDHFLGWLPGANGMQAGLSFADTVGNTYPTYALTDYQGCGHADPDHSYSGGRVEYDGGKCDGFLKRAPVGDQFPYRLLRAIGPCISRSSGSRMDNLQQLFRRNHGGDVSQSNLPARRAN
jgi:hypothetical protein